VVVILTHVKVRREFDNSENKLTVCGGDLDPFQGQEGV